MTQSPKMGSRKDFSGSSYKLVDTGRTKQFAMSSAQQIGYTGYYTKVIAGVGPLGDKEWQVYSRPKRLGK